MNGGISLLHDAKIDINDAGLRQGYGVFETMRGYDGDLFRLEDHLARMQAGAEFLGIEADMDKVKTAVFQTLKASALTEARVRPVITGGRDGQATVIVTAEIYQPPTEAAYRRGLSATIVSVRRSTATPVYRYKTLNQIENVLAAVEARSQNVDEAIMLNERGEVAETNRGNIFIVKDGVLLTPDLGAGILPGITRVTLLEIARKLSIRIIEDRVTPEDLADADELFITSSMVEVMPLTSINGIAVATGGAGAITTELRSAYRSGVRIGLT